MLLPVVAAILLSAAPPAEPARTPEEEAEDREVANRLPDLRKEWAAAYKEYAAVSDAPEPVDPAARAAHRRTLDGLPVKPLRGGRDRTAAERRPTSQLQ